MLVRRFGGRALRVLMVVVATVSAAVAGFLAAPVRARNPVCANAGVTSTDGMSVGSDGCADGDVSVPATTTETSPVTSTETAPATELPGEATTVTEEPAVEPLAPSVTTASDQAQPPPVDAATSSRAVRPPPPVRPSRSGSDGPAAPTTAPTTPAVVPFVRPQSATPALDGGPYVFPVVGQTSFGDSWGAARADVGWHHGVDIFARRGAPVVAVAEGTLASVGWNRIGGRRLWLRDRAGNYFYYAHLSGFTDVARDGAQVSAGTVIGFVGNTGDARGTPYHLHFEIHPRSLLQLGYDGAVDPFGYVLAWQSRAVSDERAAAAGTAPPAGAILLGFTDIASASGGPESLHAALEAQPHTALPVSYPAQAPTTPDAAAPSSRHRPTTEELRLVRALDAAAGRDASAPGGIWRALARCESGGDWTADTGNGYRGGLQFLPQTWVSHGGTLFAASPELATPEQQVAIAERVLATQGWRAWPACSALLGLGAHD